MSDQAGERRARFAAFLTICNLIEDRELPLECSEALRAAPGRPFLGRYTIRIDRRAAAVFDGDQLVGSYVPGRLASRSTVHPSHRGQGIAPAMIAAWWSAHPERMPPQRLHPRTRGGHAASRRAFALLFPDSPELPCR